MLKSGTHRTVRAKQRLGKNRIERKLGEGGFAVVYQATDTIEGTRVALKIPYGHLVTDEVLEVFRREVRLAARARDRMTAPQVGVPSKPDDLTILAFRPEPRDAATR